MGEGITDDYRILPDSSQWDFAVFPGVRGIYTQHGPDQTWDLILNVTEHSVAGNKEKTHEDMGTDDGYPLHSSSF